MQVDQVVLREARAPSSTFRRSRARWDIAGGSVYAASKHAVEGLTKSAALQGAAAGVRVNAVAPGPVATEMLESFVSADPHAKQAFLATIPARRAASADEIAQTIVFLAGDKAHYLTGQCLAVDGGFTAQ
jgi:NAD(P)-dependent dehydrogenase (short-subunit alcohol dehydrogenase family)